MPRRAASPGHFRLRGADRSVHGQRLKDWDPHRASPSAILLLVDRSGRGTLDQPYRAEAVRLVVVALAGVGDDPVVASQ